MPRRKLTEAYVYELIYEAKKRFYTSHQFDQRIKNILKDITPCIILNDDMCDMWYATAGIAHSRSWEVSEYNLKETMPHVMIEGRMSWYVIELNLKWLKKANKGTVYDTVSHELAHLLEMRIKGNYNRTDNRYHNAYWKNIHRAMGGSGMATEEGYRKWLLKNKSVKS